MCGIAGLIAKQKISEEKYEALKKAADLMSHRGPDHSDYYRKDNVLLIHYRLSIIDLDPRSHQPFHSKTNQHCCVYNGEIYNFNELKKRHQITTATTSDTEVMLESFETHGEYVIKEWNGIFAMAILNKENGKLKLIRDRFGVKPLYLYEDDQVILFASEAKVILDWLPQFKIDYKGLAEYMWYGNTISDHTLIENVYKVAPASIITIDTKLGKLESTTKFWEIKGTKKTNKSLSNVVKDTKILLEKAIRRQLIADVPLGVLLSGGVDSSAIVAIASKYADKKLDTYSVEYDFNIGGKSELPNARLIANKYNTNHHEFKIEAQSVSGIFSDLVFQYDEPFADAANIPLYQLAKACSRDKKVILQGDGGDEFFAGYRRYNIMNSLWFWKTTSFLSHRLMPKKRWAERMKRLSFVLNQKENGLRMAYYLTEDVAYDSPYKVLNEKIKIRLQKETPFLSYIDINEKYKTEDKVQKLLYADTSILLPNTYLEKVDKATMLCSIESRVPFLDNDLTEYALQLPSKYKVRYGQKKYILKQALKGMVPDEILYGKKRGFGVPFKEWLRTDLYDFARSTFEQLPSGFILNKKMLIESLDNHKNHKRSNGPLLWKSLVLAFWLSIYKDKLIE